MEPQKLLSSVTQSFLVYLCLAYLLPHSVLPTLALLLLMATTLYRSSFPWLVRRLVNTEMTKDKQAIVDAVATLQAHEKSSLAWNDKKRRTLRMAGWDANQQAKEIGYLSHIDRVDQAIKVNAQLADSIAEFAIGKYDLGPMDVRAGIPKGNGKAIEVLTHYARDWAADMSEWELQPLLSFIKESVKNVDIRDTVVIVPGSGLGRVAHELAEMKFPRVETVEFSALMHLCNEFVYAGDSKFAIHPFLYSYSHHITVDNHLRSVGFQQRKQPENLNLNYGDFTKFQVPDTKEYKNVLIVTAFFLDTAQNMFDYFEAIEKLIGEGQRGVWINVGPLKYGTAPYVEFSLEEIQKIRRIRGWRDLIVPKAGDMAGYLTDREGLWQGYYGLGKWVSEMKK